MDILIIGSRRYPPDIGGIERYIYEFAKVASSFGHRITVITQRYKGEKPYEKFGNIEVIRGFSIHFKPLDQLFLLMHTLLKKVGDYDVVWGHGVTGTIVTKWRPYVHTMHGFTHFRQDKQPPFNWIAKKLEYYIMPRTDMNIAVDKQTYEILKEYNPESYLVENGVNLHRFEVEYEDPYDGDRKNVLFAGRLEGSKGVMDLIEGFDTCGDKVLHIIGDGLLKDEVVKRASASDCIVYHGRVESVEEYFQHADLYVLASYHEGFPTTVLEAMAARTPTVITDIPSYSGIFKDSVETLLFSPGDVDGMMEKIDEILSDEALCERIVSNAYSKVKNEYSWEAKTREILGLFEKLVEENDG